MVEDTFKGSARREASAKIGDTEVTINYGSPGKGGRVIWNGLVSYDQVWVSGSHWATAVDFSEAVEVAGQKVEAGTYGFFTILGKESWTLILNENYDQHLADEYEEDEDIVRVILSPENLNQKVQRLTYEVTSTSENEGEISLSWDQIRVSLLFKTL